VAAIGVQNIRNHWYPETSHLLYFRLWTAHCFCKRGLGIVWLVLWLWIGLGASGQGSVIVGKKSSPYSITERRVPGLIPVLGSQPAGYGNHKPDGRLPLLSARPAVTPATIKRAATNFAAWWTEAQWVWTVCLRLLPDSVATAIWTRALLRLSPAR